MNLENAVHIIAEAGVNHNGNLDTALDLVDSAAAAGADAVKFQTFTAAEVVTPQAPKARYQTRHVAESQYEMLKRLELRHGDYETISRRCDRLGIEFLSTAFSIPGVDLLDKLGVRRFKVPSGEITNLPYLEHIGGRGKPVILSTGMCELIEVEQAIGVLEAAGMTRGMMTLLHCTTEYPAPYDEVNLRGMLTMRDRLQLAVGYSDHTLGIAVPVAAVALGATIIEKHLTLDRNQPGPDHSASTEPAEFTQLVQGIRQVEQALGDGVKQPTRSELKNLTVVRRSLVAARDIDKGEVFTRDNIEAKRPATGISPMRLYDVLGKPAKRAFCKDDIIEL